MQVHGIIPARFASTRFPGKPLALIHGKAMIQHVYEQCQKSTALDQVIVATDDDRIADFVKGFGGKVQMTASHHHSGTDRIAEIAESLPEEDIIINIQGDEPFIDPRLIDQVAAPLLHQKAQIVSAAKRLKEAEALNNPNVVKVVFGKTQKALYFSRHPIPFQRGMEPTQWIKKGDFYQHIGIYGFQASVLKELSKLSVSPLEQQESLEQLRWLDNGYSIFMQITSFESFGVDTPEDLQRIENHGQ